MTTVEVLRIRKAILHRVYGKFEVYMHWLGRNLLRYLKNLGRS
jgi:hypothetical protein